MAKLKVGLIGCGAIGYIISDAIKDGKAGDTELVMVYDVIKENAEKCIQRMVKKPEVAKTPDELIVNDQINLIIEAASQEVVKEYAIKILNSGKDLLILSIGALVDKQLLKEIEETAERNDKMVYLPSGAIAGLDGVKSASTANLTEVTLTSRKPPNTLKGAPYIVQHEIDLESINKPTVVYEGDAEEGARMFPQNINVAAVLSLAGIGAERTRVRIVADPTVHKNVHEIAAKGDFGTIYIHVENVPSLYNPKTSYLAALSVIRTLRKIGEHVQIGT
ncbi:MAG: aspartate dehydrogenase [Candidatus Hodarchaeota archaeon]